MIRIDAWRQNLAFVEDDIREAARQAGRAREDIQLIVVTKAHSVDIVEELLELGVRDIGESYVQEALEKQAVIAEYEPKYEDARWHMIGHVQSRKAGAVAEAFDWVHSVDSLKLARRLGRFAEERGQVLKALLQVNVSGEESKYGLDAKDEDKWPALAEEVGELVSIKGLDIQGLMSIPPFDPDESVARAAYAKTRRLRELLSGTFREHAWTHLSTGMSGDFKAAILEGATMLRLGSVILGPRPD